MSRVMLLCLLLASCDAAYAREFEHTKTGSMQTFVEVNGAPYINPETGKQKYFLDPEAAIVFCAQLGQTDDTVDTCAYRRGAVAGTLQFARVDVVQPRTVVFSWSTPTTRENGAPLPRIEIADYTLSILNKTTGTPYSMDVLTETVSLEVVPGSYVAAVIATDIKGLASKSSNSVDFTAP